ncbi:hypothetical protein [Ruicaihuangia caeni]|uniref:hypothetical protein n=1 Tax=Ruicaihuangia caeni TaxID=3042517 RepID=UPI00338DB758
MSNETPHRDEPSRDPEFGGDEIIRPADESGRTPSDDPLRDAAEAPSEDDALRAAAEHDARRTEAERMAARDEAEREAGFESAMNRDNEGLGAEPGVAHGATPVSDESGRRADRGDDEVRDAHEFHRDDARDDRDVSRDRGEPTPLIEPESRPAYTPAPAPPAPAAPVAPGAAGVADERDWDVGTPATVQASSETVAPTTAEPVASAPASAPEAATAAYPAAAATTAYPSAPAEPVQPQVVYVTQPNPPRDRGNRGIGALLAIAAAIIFALLYAGAAMLLITVANQGVFEVDSVTSFFLNAAFWAPVAVFAVTYVLLAVLVNRAGWWAHALGGLVVALLTYFSFVAVAVWSAGGTVDDFRRLDLWFHPLAVSVFVLAREVPIWFGAAIGARGRRVRARNIEAREQYEREQAAARAEANITYR